MTFHPQEEVVNKMMTVERKAFKGDGCTHDEKMHAICLTQSNQDGLFGLKNVFLI